MNQPENKTAKVFFIIIFLAWIVFEFLRPAQQAPL